MTPVHWYHFHCGGAVASKWEEPLAEHVSALELASFPGECKLGLVGGMSEQREAQDWLSNWWPSAEIAVQADEGFEMVTLAAMHAWSKTADPATPILYCHAKGSFQDYPENHRWRRCMTTELVNGWRECLRLLNDVDAVGLHWLTPEEYPDQITGPPMFGGNFWWTTAGYIAALPPVEHASRYCAEGWLGKGNPKVRDLYPGWPRY